MKDAGRGSGAFKVYPVCEGEERCFDYRCFVNGRETPPDTARVSAVPFNRRWPGHQREKEQTELVNFLCFATSGGAEIAIYPQKPFGGVKIRPRDLDADVEVVPGEKIVIRLNAPGYFTVEPYGTEHVLHVFADLMPRYETEKGGDVLYFGAGVHDAGNIELKSGQTLFIDEGALVYASVCAADAHNIRILGRGILDNGKNREKILFEANEEGNTAACANAERQNAIELFNCKNAEIDGIVIRNSLVYNIDCISCENVHIRNIKIIGCWRYNSDGVHFANCKDCSLTDSFLRCFDDSVCVRGYAGFEYEKWLKGRTGYLTSCKNIRIAGCTIWNDWGKGLQVGTETWAEEIADVRFENCRIIRVSAGAMMICLVDCAHVRDVLFREISAEYDEYNRPERIQLKDGEKYAFLYDGEYAPPFVSFYIEKHFEYSMIKSEEELGDICGVRLENIRCFARQKPVFAFSGHSEKSGVRKVFFDGAFWNGERISPEFFERRSIKNPFCSEIRLI